MITFMGKLYDATAGEYIYRSPTEFTIQTCTNTTKLASLNMVTDEGTETTIFALTDFDGPGGANVAVRIIHFATSIHEETGEWHELRILTTNSVYDYVLIWNHSSPWNLQLIVNGAYSVIENAIPWNASEQEHKLGYMFTSANTIEELNNPGVLWMGSYYADNTASIVRTYLSYVQVSISVSDGSYYAYAPNTYFGVVAGRRFYKTYEGSCIIFWRNFTTGSKYKGPVTLVPYANIHSDVNNTDTRGSAFSGWDGRYSNNGANPSRYILINNIWWGQRAEYATTGNFNPNGYHVYESPTPNVSAWEAIINEVIEAAGVTVSYRQQELYFYLLGTFSTETEPDSDVDPDNIPPEQEPPDPIPPDDTDPYYDPTSDPTSPDYDPTKDPESPDYDPTEPHTPYRPPSEPSDPPEQEEHPPQDPIPTPETPPSYVTTNAMFTLYNPSGGDLTNLANFLWSPTWSIDTFKKIFANPLDCILGLMVMPHLNATVATKVMNVGNISTGVTMHYFTSQFYDFDCGTFELLEYYNSYLDYAPYTKVNIYLPYIGDKQLSTDEVMNKTLGAKYRFDLATGDCVAFITVNGTVLYSFSGNCAARLPLAGNNWNGIIPAITGVAISAGSMAAGLPALGAASAAAVSTMKETISHTGSISGSAGLMGIQTPYLIVTRPRQALPLGQNSFTGYPSFITESLGSLKGYTEVEQCHLEHVPATGAELEEIERLLKEGVLF